MPRRPASRDDSRRPPTALKLQLHNHVRIPVDRSLLRRVAQRVIDAEGLWGTSVLAVHLLDDARLRRANYEQRGIDETTDVLSFPLLNEFQRRESSFVLPPGEPRHLGDVLISFERAEIQAAQYGHSLQRELGYLLAHGILHLLGYDHVEAQGRRAMRQREEAALGSLGLVRDKPAG
jgi:probable rRNA maturation factor